MPPKNKPPDIDLDKFLLKSVLNTENMAMKSDLEALLTKSDLDKVLTEWIKGEFQAPLVTTINELKATISDLSNKIHQLQAKVNGEQVDEQHGGQVQPPPHQVQPHLQAPRVQQPKRGAIQQQQGDQQQGRPYQPPHVGGNAPQVRVLNAPHVQPQ